MILFTDFIKTPNPSRTKIKFNTSPNDSSKPAWNLLLEDDPEWLGMNQWKTNHPNHNLNYAEYLIALAQYYPYGPQYYVFGGLYKVEIIQPEVYNTVGYNLTLMEDHREYIKRLIIKTDKTVGRATYNRNYDKVQKQLNPEIYELAPSTMLGFFPGYQNVSIRHRDMQLIVQHREPSWENALSHVKGVYVITDTASGELYIGSASGNTDGIWQRWSGYADLNNPTGGNKEFVRVLNERGSDYIIKNFRYTILEIFDTKTKKEIILERENYWKKVFATRPHGMNCN